MDLTLNIRAVETHPIQHARKRCECTAEFVRENSNELFFQKAQAKSRQLTVHS